VALPCRPAQRHVANVGFFQPIGADPLEGQFKGIPKHVAV
jgi:hypothetical protein